MRIQTNVSAAMQSKTGSKGTKKLVQYLQECCTDTSIHGPKYLVKNNGSWIIFVLWFLICVTGLVFCVILLWLQWDAYQSQPTLTSIESTNVPIYEIRFPAVTVCNNNLVYLPATKRFTEELLKRGFENETIHDFYRHLSVFVSFRTQPHNFTRISDTIKQLGYDSSSFMYEISQPCSKLIESCRWFDGNCSQRIKKIKTQNGFCCSLNYYLPDTMEYTKDHNRTTDQIYYVSGSGSKFSLVMVINVEPDTYWSGLKPFYGAEVLIHDGFAYPEVSIIPTIGTLNTAVNLLIGAHTVITDEQVRSIPMEKRSCCFEGETMLESSANYSYETCVSECRVNRMIDLCECVPYYYRYAGKVRYCDMNDIPCLNQYQTLFYSIHNPNADNASDFGLDLKKCKCYPECNDITYDVQTETHTFLPNASFFLPAGRQKALSTENKVLLFATYQQLTLIQYRKDVRVSWNNLLASLGGIFGLCVGGSVISIAEFFYFVVLYFFKKPKKMKMKTINSISQFKVQPLMEFPRKVVPNNRPCQHRFAPRFRINYFE